MKPDSQLASLLGKINADALQGFTLDTGRSAQLLVAAENGRGKRAGNGDGVLPPDFLEGIKDAVRQIRDGHEPDRFRPLRLACWGCCTFIPDDGYVLVADVPTMARLLSHVDGYREDLRRFRRLFDGLLRSYLGAARDEPWFSVAVAQQGTEVLRAFLEDAFRHLHGVEPTLDWVEALQTYPEVLSIAPGRRFAADWLAGGGREFQDLSTRIGLTGSSWLAAETLRSALSAATAMDDTKFVPHIGAFLAAAAEPRFASLRDEVYAGLLTRYAALASPTVHPALRDALVAAWKNPWLARNESAWLRVPDAARTMVAGWLKLELIHQFFEVLSDDGKQDKRRFEFWREYYEVMDDVYFALSNQSYASNSADMVKLRAALDGRLLKLDDTEPGNNAFIMRIGNHWYVEFSKTGNACYVYPGDKISLDRMKGRAGISDLKRSHAAELRMLHTAGWPEIFADNIRDRLGKSIRVDDLKRRSTAELRMPHPPGWQADFQAEIGRRFSPTTSPQHSSELVSPWPAATGLTNAKLDRPPAQFITQFAGERSIPVVDHRNKGGMLWLEYHGVDANVVGQLSAWGFRYRPDRGWWRRD